MDSITTDCLRPKSGRYFLLLIFLTLFLAAAQGKKRSPEVLDSLHQLADQEEPDTNLVRACVELCGHYAQRDPAKSHHYGFKALSMANEGQVGKVYWNLGAMFFTHTKMDSATHFLELSVAHTDPVREPRFHCLALNYLGRAYQRQGDSDGFLAQTRKAYAVSKQVKDTLSTAQALIGIGDEIGRRGYLDSAMGYYLEADTLLFKITPSSITSLLHKQMAIQFERQGEMQKAIDRIYKALAIDDSIHSPTNAALCVLQLGTIFARMEDFDKAFEMYEAARLRNEKVGN
ncbi:MAG: tetratricopeptide repeat protein [Salibacteraceae bacterium]